MKRYRNALLLLAVVALAVLPMFVVEPDAAFAGADDKAKNMISEIAPDYQPWFAPLIEPASAEISSLLFALQAALGAGFIGYYLGVSRTRVKCAAKTHSARGEAVLVEQCAYANRWRFVAPAAKALFALGGLAAAFAAERPLNAAALALLIALVTTCGASIPLRRYLRVALPPLAFLAIGCLSLAASFDYRGESLVVVWLPEGWAPIAQLAARSCCALAAMLFLALTTPMTDLIALLRRIRTPEVLLEIMVLCYRMLFVFSHALHETQTAQAARLGYASPRLALRSLGDLGAHLTLQVWQRANALQRAAQSRNNDGALRFLEPVYSGAGRDLMIAAGAAALLVAFAAGMR